MTPMRPALTSTPSGIDWDAAFNNPSASNRPMVPPRPSTQADEPPRKQRRLNESDDSRVLSMSTETLADASALRAVYSRHRKAFTRRLVADFPHHSPERASLVERWANLVCETCDRALKVDSVKNMCRHYFVAEPQARPNEVPRPLYLWCLARAIHQSWGITELREYLEGNRAATEHKNVLARREPSTTQAALERENAWLRGEVVRLRHANERLQKALQDQGQQPPQVSTSATPWAIPPAPPPQASISSALSLAPLPVLTPPTLPNDLFLEPEDIPDVLQLMGASSPTNPVPAPTTPFTAAEIEDLLAAPTSNEAPVHDVGSAPSLAAPSASPITADELREAESFEWTKAHRLCLADWLIKPMVKREFLDNYEALSKNPAVVSGLNDLKRYPRIFAGTLFSLSDCALKRKVQPVDLAIAARALNPAWTLRNLLVELERHASQRHGDAVGPLQLPLLLDNQPMPRPSPEELAMAVQFAPHFDEPQRETLHRLVVSGGSKTRFLDNCEAIGRAWNLSVPRRAWGYLYSPKSSGRFPQADLPRGLCALARALQDHWTVSELRAWLTTSQNAQR